MGTEGTKRAPRRSITVRHEYPVKQSKRLITGRDVAAIILVALISGALLFGASMALSYLTHVRAWRVGVGVTAGALLMAATSLLRRLSDRHGFVAGVLLTLGLPTTLIALAGVFTVVTGIVAALLFTGGTDPLDAVGPPTVPQIEKSGNWTSELVGAGMATATAIMMALAMLGASIGPIFLALGWRLALLHVSDDE